MSKKTVENKVLEFPKAQTVRKRLMDRTQDQKAVLGLSIVSVLIMTVFMNEWIMKSQEKMDSFTAASRGLASFEDRNSVEGIQWEHELAQQLAQDKISAKSLLAVKPTLKDELVFGFLEGKYKTHVANNKIQSFDFTASQSGEEPLVIREKAEFLKIFKSVFSVEYAKVQLQGRQDNHEVYSLIDSKNQNKGQADFELDAEGRVLSLKITQ